MISVCIVTILFGACLIVSMVYILCCCADKVSIAKAVFVVNKKRRISAFSGLSCVRLIKLNRNVFITHHIGRDMICGDSFVIGFDSHAYGE